MVQQNSPDRISIQVGDGSSLIHSVKASPEGNYSSISEERRRAILRAIACESTSVTLQTRSTAVVTREQTANTDPGAAERPIREHMSLNHTQLPKLDDCRPLKFDPEAMTIGRVADTVKQGGV